MCFGYNPLRWIAEVSARRKIRLARSTSLRVLSLSKDSRLTLRRAERMILSKSRGASRSGRVEAFQADISRTTIWHLLVFLTRFYHSVIPMKLVPDFDRGMGIQIFLLILDSRLDPAFAARSFASAE